MFRLSKHFFYILLTVQLCVVAGIGFSIYQFIKVGDNISVSDHLLVAIDAIGMTLLNAETGQRGYLITGNTEYLHPYNSAQITLSDQLSDLNSSMSLVDRYHPRVDRVTKLSKEKMDELRATIYTRTHKSLDDAIAEVKSGKGKEIMDEIRVLLAEITTSQSKRIDALQVSLKFYGFTILSGLIIFVLISVLYSRHLRPPGKPTTLT
jgi:methyl-accepting chemotaxis protein